VFASTVLMLMGCWWLVRQFSRPHWPPRRVHPGVLGGGVLFGLGWALSGACPSIAMVQLGEGQLGALWTVTGIVLGNWMYARVHARYFGWSAASCADE